MLLEEVFTHVFVVEDSMPAKVETDWFLSEDFLDAFCGALSFRYINLYLGSADAFADLHVFLCEVELGEVLERFVLLLKHDWRGKHESKMDFLLENAHHVAYFLKHCLVLLQNENHFIDLTGLLLILVVQEALLGHREYRNMCLVLDCLIQAKVGNLFCSTIFSATVTWARLRVQVIECLSSLRYIISPELYLLLSHQVVHEPLIEEVLILLIKLWLGARHE